MKLPSRIVIGTQVWEVSEQKRKHSSDPAHFGWTGEQDNVIVVDANLSNSMKRTTLLHEVLHAVRVSFGGSFRPSKSTDFDDWEHFFIGLYEEPLLLILRTNPELLEFLLSDD